MATPSPGPVVSLAPSPDFADDGTVAAGTAAGVYLTVDGGSSWRRAGGSLAPLLVTAVALGPRSAGRLLLAGGVQGVIFRSRDGGQTWQRGRVSGSSVTQLAIPAGPPSMLAFAATLGDGVLRSEDGGESWRAWTMGLLDLRVLALAVSPGFADDQTLLAGTASGLFRSRNGGRAWRELERGPEAAVTSVALSPGFPDDGLALAGTESRGVFVSDDGGGSWRPVPGLPEALTADLVAFAPHFPRDGRLFLTGGRWLWISEDAGRTWSRRFSFPQAVLGLALSPNLDGDGLAWVALAGGGVHRSVGGALDRWEEAGRGLEGRLLAGMTVDEARQRPNLYAFGPWEGVLRLSHGDSTFEPLEGLPSPAVAGLVLGREGSQARTRLWAAQAEGVWTWAEGGGGWEALSDFPARALAAAPSFPRRPSLLAGRGDRGLSLSQDGGRSWRELEVPFDGPPLDVMLLSGRGEDLLALVDDAPAHRLQLWRRGRAGWWEVSLAAPSPRWGFLAGPGSSPFACLAGRLFRVRPDAAAPPAQVAMPGGRDCLALAPLPAPRKGWLVAAAEEGTWLSVDAGRSWQPVGGGPAEPVMALVPAVGGKVVYAAAIGGSVWRLELETGP